MDTKDYTKLFDQGTDILEQAARNTRLLDAQAKYKMAQYESLLRVGFLPEQAIHLVTLGPLVAQQ